MTFENKLVYKFYHKPNGVHRDIVMKAIKYKFCLCRNYCILKEVKIPEMYPNQYLTWMWLKVVCNLT